VSLHEASDWPFHATESRREKRRTEKRWLRIRRRNRGRKARRKRKGKVVVVVVVVVEET
jgi:hypothetical protein